MCISNSGGSDLRGPGQIFGPNALLPAAGGPVQNFRTGGGPPDPGAALFNTPARRGQGLGAFRRDSFLFSQITSDNNAARRERAAKAAAQDTTGALGTGPQAAPKPGPVGRTLGKKKPPAFVGVLGGSVSSKLGIASSSKKTLLGV